MKENNIEEFFKKHSRQLPMTASLQDCLQCLILPQPIIKEQSNTWIVVLISTLVGFIAFAIMVVIKIFRRNDVQ